MNNLWWFLTRSTGIVATLLAVAALVFGLFFSARNTGNRRRPNWWLDLHNYLGGLTVAFTLAHVIAAWFDTHSDIGFVQIFIPGTAANSTWAITWGVIATYIFVLTTFTSWPRRRFSRRTWRLLHLTSVFGMAVTLLHAFQVGSDATELLFEAFVIGCAAVGVYAISLRVIGAATKLFSR